jgi:site-specific recombinase XerD
MEQAIQDFPSHILAERGLSPQTEYAYRHDLRQLPSSELVEASRIFVP